MYEVSDFAVTPAQLVKLWKGNPIQLSAQALKNPNSRVYVHPETYKKIRKAQMKGSGCRIYIGQDEIMKTGPRSLTGAGRMAGMGWYDDAWDSLTKAANWIAEKAPQIYQDYVAPAIQSDFYQQNIRPKIRSAAENFLETKPYSDVSIPMLRKLGDQTGAFGVKKPKSKCKPKPKAGSFKTVGY
jgi:hypothetical protein